MGKFKGKLKTFKEFVFSRKKQISIVAIILIVIAIATSLIYKNVRQARMLANNPELAKAMTYDEVKEGEEIVEGTNGNVKFDAFFLRDLNGDGYAESIRGTSRQIGKEDTLYMELNVDTAGYLKDAKITVNDGGNFYLQTALPKDDELKDNYIGNNIKVIEFNQLNNGTQKMLTGIVRSGNYSYASAKNAAIGNNINNYGKVNSITLTGTYVTEDNIEIPITKTVNFNIDWYGTTKVEVTSTEINYDDLENRIDIEKGVITLDFSIKTEEMKKELLLKSNYVEAQIPQLNGYDPLDVKYTGNNAISNYNKETKILTISRESAIESNGDLINKISTINSYNIKVEYPLIAFSSLGADTISIKIPIVTYYEGYNNKSPEFTNPYKSLIGKNTIVANYKNPIGTVVRFDIAVGKYYNEPTERYVISKNKALNIYNSISDMEEDDTYQVMWKVIRGIDGSPASVIMKETQDGEKQKVDNFIKTDSTIEEMENITANVGIGFSGADNILKEDGWIKVYNDETNDLIVMFTRDNWNNYTSSNPYIYEYPIDHIRVETSETKNNAVMYVYNIKELDDEYITNKYTKEEFDNLQYIESTLTGYFGGSYINTDINQAHYEAPYSFAGIGLSNNTISTQATEKNEKIIITADYDKNSNQVGWVNGSFLVKLPEEILTAKINNVEINNSNISITSYELIEKDGAKLIKVNTENKDKTEQTYSITIDLDITPDPRTATTTKNVELYATNEKEGEYYYSVKDIYDVNDNLNIEEKVNHSSTSLSMVSPNSLLTNQIGSNYDDKGNKVISPQIADIRPAYSVVDHENEKEATIGIQIKNNYTSTISEITILGKIPFEGNTYVLSGGDLGSTFTTKMKNTGIVIPEDLKQYVTVYYSDNDNPDKDLNKVENNWKTQNQVTNWDNIKTFLIDLGSYVMPTGAEYVFNYTVMIPNGINFDQVAFSHHGVYFSLDTDQGKYRTQVEPNELGFKIAEKYNLELTKYQTGKDKLVAGATYSVTDEETGETKTAVTNASGIFTINNLYAEKRYIIKEIKTPNDYELNEDSIRFIGHVDNQGNLTIEKTQGNTKEDIAVIKEENEDYKVTVKVEDEVKASIKIHKTEQGTNTPVQNVKYKLTGYNLSENGRVLTTNKDGEATISGLSINQEYTLTETKAEGYYLADPITFKIVNNDGNYTIETTNETETTINQTTEEVDSIPTITINLEDEKIPTYSMQIVKQERTTEATVSDDELIAKAETALADTEVTYLQGAKFKLYKNDEEIGEYITDQTGTVTIDNLYQYIEGKDEEATYTLKEVLAPEGYAKVKDITFKVENKDGTLQFINTSGEEENYTVEGTTVKLTIEDSPSFKLIKKDKETQEPIANVKFAIYNVEDGEKPATNSKGETLGTLETINGQEYYTLTTDDQGVLTADLTEGLYKAVEVEAPEQYDIANQTYYFGIGASREAEKDMIPSLVDLCDYSINSLEMTKDGGYIVGGGFSSDEIKIGNYTITNNGASYSSDGLIIKYSSEDEVEWVKNVGGSDGDTISSIIETDDGGYIVGGSFDSDEIKIGNYIITNNESYGSDVFLIKYDADGAVAWAKSLGGNSDDTISSIVKTSDGGYIIGGSFDSDEIIVENNKLINSTTSNFIKYDGFIIKYNSSDKVEWLNNINEGEQTYINSIKEIEDGGIIAVGNVSDSLLGGGNDDGIILKYDSNGDIEWKKKIEGTEDEIINAIEIADDGGFIIAGTFYSDEIKVGNYTITKNGYRDGFIIKYSSKGEVEWAKNLGGNSHASISLLDKTIDGGYIIGGTFDETIYVGNDTLVSNGGDDVLVAKYNSKGEAEWTKAIGGSAYDSIETVTATSDGRYIVGGSFESDEIILGNEIITNDNSFDMIYKYEMKELPNPVATNTKNIGGSKDDYINSVAETSDGGYIVAGNFSGTIQVGNEKLTSKGQDGFLIKYNSFGEVEWARAIGGTGYEYIYSVEETKDGGYIVGGASWSDEIQVGDQNLISNGEWDGLIIKYSSKGEVEWVKAIGGSKDDYINSVAETSDGGYIAGGYFESNEVKIGTYTLTKNSTSSDSDGLIIKYDSEGEVEWAKSFGGSRDDEITSVKGTADGGSIVGGYFLSKEIQVGNYILTNSLHSSYYNYSDGLIIKYNSEGEVEWAKSIENDRKDKITSIAQTNDGGYIASGYSGSDGLLIKFESEGNIEWKNLIDSSDEVEFTSVKHTDDGGFIVGGFFSGDEIQIGGETLLNKGSFNDDGLIIKYNNKGVLDWAKVIGGSVSDEISSIAEKKDGKIIVAGYFNKTFEIDNHTLKNQGGYDGMILEIVNEVGVPEVQELVVENSRKEFKITTDVKEIDGIKGGSISGEDMSSYEKVKYGENSTEPIIMTPEEGYEIIGITVNGEEWKFEENADGTYTMPQFENVIEDKHVVVTYSLKDNKIIINKVDSEDNSKKLEGATFKLDQLEERTDPNNEEIIGEIVANGQEYLLADTEKGEVEGVLGELTNNGTYYFVENSDGALVPTNSKTYQLANGETAGIQNSTANSYIPIDLSGKEGEYVVVVNANISSESSDYGYAIIKQNTTAPSYSTTTGRIFRISGTSSSVTTAKDYPYTTVLQGGQIYYLHLGYRKSSSGDIGDDQVVINSVKVYENKGISYNFVDNGSGGYESNNQGKDNTVANSYIPIDLTNYLGKYNLTVNANVSSYSGDYGYATVTSTTAAPSYSSSTGRFIYISGKNEAQDYTTELQGGQMYYLHLGYYKNSSNSSGDDKFTVNSIKVTLNDSELYHSEEITTNSLGQAITQLPFGKYQITEIVAPEGYELNSEPIVVEFREDGIHEFIIENNKKAQILVHHYLKNEDGSYTTIEVAGDELLEGKNGEKYITSPKLDLEDYELEKNEEGEYVVPENATGTFTPGVTEVIYYYEEKEIPLTVHHYIEGTEEKVPLKDGVAEDEKYNGKEGEEYHTSAIDDSLLSDDYELLEIPEKASGTYSGEEVVVTYYYKKVERQVIINKYSEDEIAPLARVEFSIALKEKPDEIIGTYTTDENGQISVALESGEYIATEVKVPEGYDIPSNNETEFAITKADEAVTLDITNTKTKGTVVTHHYIEGTTNKVPSNNGSVVEDVVQTGILGDMYATKEAENVAPKYEFVSAEGETSGKIVEGTTEVIYYYRLKSPTIETPVITKESSIEKVTEEGENIDYTINYKTTIKDYIGDAEVKIVDELPYEIDENKAYNLEGGVYNEENKTITWIEEISGIDTYTNGEKEIEITKKINFSYINEDYSQKNIVNNVIGTINLKTSEKEETVEDKKEIPTEYKVNITANKVWNDNTEQAKRRPESVTLVVKNGDKEVQSKVVTAENLVAGTTNKWSVEFTGLDKYDENGNEIQYTLEEKETNSGDLHFYEAEEDNVAIEDNQASIRNDFVVPADTTSVTVTKVWNDNENINGRRPNSIKLQIKNGESVVSEQEVNADNNWTYTFTGLPKYDDNGKEIVYTASESEVNSGDLKFYTNSGVSGDMTSGYVITNTFTVPDEKIELTVNKVWQDNATQALRRPEILTINVLGEDRSVVATYDLNTATETSHTFTGLPKYNSEGQEIEYTVEEAEKNPGDLYFYTSSVGTVENVDGNEDKKEVTITNTFERPEDTIEVTARKVWEDDSNSAEKRPESIMLLLKNETENVRVQKIDSSDEVEENVWECTFTDLDKYNSDGEEIVYSADETEVKQGDLKFYNKTINGLTVTNTFTQDTTKVEIPVTKVWIDTEEQKERRPESVIVVLKANDVEERRQEITGTGDTWQYTFKDLPKYDEFNNIINYTVEEEEVNSGDLKFYSSTVDGTTITNTFTKPNDVISLEVHKQWQDQENIFGKRPVSVRVNVKNGEEIVQTAVITKDGSWEYKFVNLPKYDKDGKEIEYKVEEEEVLENELCYYTGNSGEVIDKIGETDAKEVTITNSMTKIPGKVIVRYKDKATGEEISEAKEKEGIIGDNFDVTVDEKEIQGYTLVEEPEEKTGTYTPEVQEKTYYYAKNTRVIVKYLEKDNTSDDSDNKVLSDEIILGGYEGKSYTTNSKEIEGYTLVETKGDLSGTMAREEKVVVYYYSKDTKVIVKYLEKDDTPNDINDNKVLLPEKTIEGYVGEEYATEGEKIPNYTLVEKTTNFEGTMTEDVIEVIYYYAKNTNVIVKYLEKDDTEENNEDNKVLAEEVIISGYEGKEYKTEKKTINNYTYVEDTGNTSGKMEENQIEVIYYYAQNTKAKVEHIDRETGTILKEETQEGKVGDLFETHAEDFEGYVLVEEPSEPNIIMDKTGKQVVRYYYAHVSAGVIEKHIDIITGELLESSEHSGNEGDPYDIQSKEFSGYDLVEEDHEGNSMLPTNSSGTMKRDEVIEVKYYYIKKVSVVVKYVDETTGEEISGSERIEGHENDEYTTEKKDIEDYNLSKIPENASGTMTVTKNEDGTYDTEIEVIYYYKKQAGGVIENHIDVDSNKVLVTEKHEGNIGDEYDIPSREFSGYDLVIDNLPNNSKGEMTEEKIEVNYYYKKKAKVVVEYIDKQTGEKITEDEIIQGHIGDDYKTEEKTFDGYDLIEKPTNGEGEMTEEEIVVKYYYERKAEVEVKYLEKGTDYEVEEGETISGHVGDKYETEQKEVAYYKFVEKTTNWKGNMTKEKITVIYYYEKEIFNLGVDKWVESVEVNGISSPAQSIETSDEIYKVDIHRSKADTANIKVTYKIRITNKGEIEGTVGKITDIIPTGYTYNQEDNELHFENENGILTTEDLKEEVIKPGENKEIEVTLRVNRGSENFGQKDNMVILAQIDNPAGYEDIDKEDNHDTSSMIITIATGLDRNDRIVIIGIVQIVLAITIGLLLSYKRIITKL